MPTTAANRAPREVPELDDVRARILSAAEGVFAARGYAGATTREIAERAGIGKRMLFYYFPSKDAVYRAVLERILVGLVAIHEHTRNAPGPVGLADAIEAITHFSAQNLTAMKVWLREIIDAGPHLEELTHRYLRPLYDALHDMVDPESIPKLLAAGTIEVAPLAFLRGRSLNDSFIILDEAQNTTPEQMKMFLTRLGFGSKIVVTGDVTQIDLPSGSRSGLKVVEDILTGVEDVAFNRLTSHDVVRHQLVGRIVAAYDEYDAREERPGQGRPRA